MAPWLVFFSSGGVAVFAQSVTHNVCARSFAQPAPCQSKKILRQLATNMLGHLSAFFSQEESNKSSRFVQVV